MATNQVSPTIANALASPSIWDLSATTYPRVGSQIQFTAGYAKECWDLAVTDKTNIRVLDIACGTGALSIPAAVALKETGGSVLATDFSPKMIDIINESVKEIGISNIEGRVEDGQNLLSPNNSFDYAFSIFGMIFFPDFAKGLSEAYRVLKPGGKLVIATWTPINLWLGVGLELIKRHNVPISVLKMLEFGNKDNLSKRFSDAGFTDVKIVENTKEMPFADFNMVLGMTSTNPGFVSINMELGLSQEDFDKEVLAILKEKYPNLPVNVSNTALFAVGTKPAN